jgi:hypothetical protein
VNAKGAHLLALSLLFAAERSVAACTCPTVASCSCNICATPAVAGTNPSVAEWNSDFQLLSQGPSAWGTRGPAIPDLTAGCHLPQAPTSVPAVFPCEILRAMAMRESGWTQFCISACASTPQTVVRNDCGSGAFQITYGMRPTDPVPTTYLRERVVAEPFYNGATAALFLQGNWQGTQCVGDNQPDIVEDWYFAVWKYGPGQATAANNPNNPNLNMGRGVYNPNVSQTSSGWTYQELIWGWMENPPSGQETWTALQPAYPALGDIPWSYMNSPPQIPEPHCEDPIHCVTGRFTHHSTCLPMSGKGTIVVAATINGESYTGPVAYTLSGASSITGTQTSSYSNVTPGGYTIAYNSGGPSGAILSGYAPPASQLLQAGGSIQWTLNFVSSGPPYCSASSSPAVRRDATLADSCGGSVTVSIAGSGAGAVTSNPSGISCPGACSTSFASGTQVVLSATPSLGSVFSGWTGDPACSTGSITVNANYSCTANFTANAAAYTLTVSHNGGGTITTSDGGINCGGTCSQTYVAGTAVTLDASAFSGWSFSSWSGSCSGGPVDQFYMTGNMNCTANFVLNPQPTPVTTTGSATNVMATSAQLNGTINPENFAAQAYFEYGPDPNLGYTTPFIPFGAAINTFFPYGQPVTGLACNTTYRFRAVGVGAGGDYRASTNTFTTAQCPPAPCYPLNLIPNGDAPAPTASPFNSSGCPYGQYHAGDQIALSVAPVAGDVLFAWGGTNNNASTASTNTATMTAPSLTVYALYEHICYHLSLGFTGNGSALVATDPVPSCPAGYFPWGYQVDLTASPATGWRVGNWNGTISDSSTSSTNNVIMPVGDSTALVQYVPLQYPLQVFPGGNGFGTITSSLPGINCGPTCSASFPYGTTITLEATPSIGSSFGGWNSDCAGGIVNFPPGAICRPTFSLSPVEFYTISPCRAVDTRSTGDPNGPAITSGEYRLPVLVGNVGNCTIPTTAIALSVNVTIVLPSSSGFLSFYPDLGVPPSTSTINFRQGDVRANNAILSLNAYGGVTVYGGLSGTVDYIIDVNGYFQ